MAANPPSPAVALVQRPSTRLVTSGLISLAPGASQDFVGSDARQERIQIVVTNMDAALYLLWSKLNDQVCGAIFAQLPWTLETSADIRITNPSGNGSNISFYVSELYPDTGNAHGIPRALGAVAGGGAVGGTTSGGTGGTTSGGSTGGSSGPGGTQTR